jgi:hypothetical protein
MLHTTPSTRSPWFHLLGSPIIWGAHFLVSYLWVEAACQAHLLVLDSTILGLTVLSYIVLALTIAAVAATLYVGRSAYHQWQRLRQIPTLNEASHWAVEGEQFMAFSGVLLSGLFTLTILLTGLPALVLRPC